LQKTHSYLFGWLYFFAVQIKAKTISKRKYPFANSDFLTQIIKNLDEISDSTFDEI